MLRITNSGRTAITDLLINAPLHLAWGRGDAAWTPSDYDGSALLGETDLFDEVARRTVAVTGFVTPDPAGAIVIGTGDSTARYSLSATPTNLAYVKVIFDTDEAPTETIAELGLFIGTAVDPALPAGQPYFTPSEVVDGGTLVALARLSTPIVRDPATRQMIELVLEVIA